MNSVSVAPTAGQSRLTHSAASRVPVVVSIRVNNERVHGRSLNATFLEAVQTACSLHNPTTQTVRIKKLNHTEKSRMGEALQPEWLRW